MTDSLPQEAAPLSEAALRATLAWAEKWDEAGTTALARECLRLRGLLAEAAGALKLVRAFGSHGESVGGYSVSYFVEKAIAAVESDTELAAAVAARVRGHLNPTETPE